MITVTVTNDKVIHTQNDSIVFEGENLIDIIHINICKIIGSVNISGFSFLFDYININNVGDSIQLNDYAVDSDRDDFLAFEIPVTNELTLLSGKIKCWIRIIDVASSLIAKTAEREINIIDHTIITDLIPEQSLTLLDQWQVYMDTTKLAAQNAMNISSGNLSAISVIKNAVDGQVVTIIGYTQDALNSKNASETARGLAESYTNNPPTIGVNKNWLLWNGIDYIDSGNMTQGRGVESITLTGTVDLVDTYITTYSDGSTNTFTVTNGSDGDDGITPVKGVDYHDGTNGVNGTDGTDGRGIVSIVRTAGNGAAGTTDTFTITYSNSTTSTFSVYNGTNGADGTNGTNGTNGAAGRGITSIVRTSGAGTAGTTDTYTITYSDATTTTFGVYNGADGAGTGDMLKATYDITNNGIVDNAEKVNGHMIETDVPIGAVFTDTVTTINGKTGIIAKTDITALGIPAQDTVYTHPSEHSADMITDGTTNKAYTAIEKTKLAGIADSANNYTHPANHAISVITGLQTALDSKVDDSQVLTNVPVGAIFTDTVYIHPGTHSADMIVDGTTNKSYTAAEKTKIAAIAAGAEVNVQSDWSAVSGDAQILNKPATVSGYGITDAYTKSEVDTKVSSVYRYKGSVANYAALPSTAQVVGDVYNLTDSGINYAWTGTVWDDIGGVESLATSANNGLMTKEDFSKLAGIAVNANNYVHPVSHTISITTGLQTALDSKIDDSQVLTNVPVGALFTDTVTTVNGKTGVIVKADIVALGIPAQDTVYTHPAAHDISVITDLQTALDGKVDDSQVLTNVPYGALFTDTVYTHPTTTGNKHVPAGGSANQVLKYSADGTAAWGVDDDTVYTHPIMAGNKHIPSGGSANQVLKYSADGTATWDTDTDTIYTHPLTHSADIITDGITNKAYTDTEKTKLAGIAIGAEVNVNPDWNAVSGDGQILNKPTTITGYGIVNAYTKSEVDNIVSSVYKYRGNVASYANLPVSAQVIGDTYNLTDSGINYAWNGTGWDDIGGVEALATASNNGLMTNDDFVKLFSVATGANNYTHPATHDADMITDDITAHKFVTASDITILGNTSGTNSGDETPTTAGTLISGATNKAVPVDADTVGISDSVASNILKKLTWSNIKATLKTYFDTLYSLTGHTHIATDLPAASTSDAGIAQLSDLTDETSSVKAATPTAVKAAYDLSSAAVPKAGGTLTGDLISNNPAIGTQAVRNISLGITDLTAGVSALPTGELYFVYE